MHKVLFFAAISFIGPITLTNPTLPELEFETQKLIVERTEADEIKSSLDEMISYAEPLINFMPHSESAKKQLEEAKATSANWKKHIAVLGQKKS